MTVTVIDSDGGVGQAFFVVTVEGGAAPGAGGGRFFDPALADEDLFALPLPVRSNRPSQPGAVLPGRAVVSPPTTPEVPARGAGRDAFFADLGRTSITGVVASDWDLDFLALRNDG